MPDTPFERLIAAERGGDLWRQRVLGYEPWALERLRRHRSELLEGDGGEEVGLGETPAQRWARQRGPLLLAARDLARAPRFPRARDIWVLSASVYRRRDASGEAQCIFTRDLEAQLGHRILFLERDTNGIGAAYRPDVRHIDAHHLAAMAAARTLAPWAARRGAVSPEQERLFHPLPPAELCRLAIYGRLMERAARAWIRAARPRAVFVLCGYQPFIPIQRAVRAHGIPLIELQHGLIHPTHPGYVLGDAPELDHLPDHLLVFGRAFGEMLERESPRWRGRWSVGGHRWLADAAARAALPAGERRDVVFFSQTDPPVRSLIAEVVHGCVDRLPEGLRIVVKPHPRETDATAHWNGLAGPRVRIASHHDDSYALLAEARAAVSVYSTVAVEALAFGCPSVVLRSPLWTEDIRVFVEQGVLHAATDADELMALLAAPVPTERAGDLADALFAVREAPLDFERLIAEVATRGAASA